MLILICLDSSLNSASKNPQAVIFAPKAISLQSRVEFCVTLSPDELEAFFAVRKGPGLWEIHQARRVKDAWQASAPLPFSGSFSDSEPTLSPDGQRLFFSSNRPVRGSEPSQDFNIWMVERQNDGWSTPRPLPEPINGPGDQWRASQSRSGDLFYSSRGLWTCSFDGLKAGSPIVLFDPQAPTGLIGGHAFITPDGQTLLTAWMDGPGGQGSWDLYVSFRDEQGKWSASVNLGDSVNTAAGEDFPLLSPNGNTLYFFRYEKDVAGEKGDIYHIDAAFIQALRPRGRLKEPGAKENGVSDARIEGWVRACLAVLYRGMMPPGCHQGAQNFLNPGSLET